MHDRKQTWWTRIVWRSRSKKKQNLTDLSISKTKIELVSMFHRILLKIGSVMKRKCNYVVNPGLTRHVWLFWINIRVCHAISSKRFNYFCFDLHLNWIVGKSQECFLLVLNATEQKGFKRTAGEKSNNYWFAWHFLSENFHTFLPQVNEIFYFKFRFCV